MAGVTSARTGGCWRWSVRPDLVPLGMTAWAIKVGHLARRWDSYVPQVQWATAPGVVEWLEIAYGVRVLGC